MSHNNLPPADSYAGHGQASGKIILCGEHSVVYGTPAIALAIDRGIRVKVSLKKQNGAEGPTFTILQSEVLQDVSSAADSDKAKLLLAFRCLADLFGERIRDLHFSIESSIPSGCGLGSSAAISVALVRAIASFLGEEMNQSRTEAVVMKLERIFHGNPSGIDHSTIIHDGLIWFQTDAQKSGMVERLSITKTLRFAVGVTARHMGTSDAIANLRKRIQNQLVVYKKLFSGMEYIARCMAEALAEGNLRDVGELMNLNQGYLNALGVSTPKLEMMCAIARDRGALGAKLTGSGYGGAVIALTHSDPEDIKRGFLDAGFQAFTMNILAKDSLHACRHLSAVANPSS